MHLQPGSAAGRLSFIGALAMALTLPRAPVAAQAMGEELFRGTCAACHTTGTDRLVGPGLQGVGDRRDPEWLVAFITEPDRMLSERDSIATGLLAEYVVPMPNLGLSRAQARSVLDYIAGAADGAARDGASSGPDPRLAPEAQPPPTDDQVRLGQALFQGDVRLTHGGPTCNSCHDVTHDAVIGGGVLARELTTVFSRLGGPGVRAILGSPPFPVMQRAYADRPLTEEEVAGLVAFLQRADEEKALHRPRDYGIKLFGTGVLGAALLLGLYSLAWRGRRRGSVHRAIFDRQVSST